MAAYVIADSKVHDPETMKAYGAKVGDTLKKIWRQGPGRGSTR